jgi:hypothetical protein
LEKECIWLVESSGAKNRAGKVGKAGGKEGGETHVLLLFPIRLIRFISHNDLPSLPPSLSPSLQAMAYKLMARVTINVMTQPQAAFMR